MISTIRLAWRNLGRNRRRSVITGLALAIGVTLSVACFGLIDGISASLLHSLTRFDLGHVQVHTQRYQETRRPEALIEGYDRVVAEIQATEGVLGASGRVYGYALTSREQRSAGLEIVGVDPRLERKVTELQTRLKQGRFLEDEPTPWPPGRALTAEEQAQDEALTQSAESSALEELDALQSLDAAVDDGAKAPADAPPTVGAPSEERLAFSRKLAEIQSPPPLRHPRVILGTVAARILHVEVGDVVHVSARSLDGSTRDVDVEIIGLFETGTIPLDRRMLLHLADLQRLEGLGNRVHEVAAVLDDPNSAPAIAAAISSRLHEPTLLVRPWNQIRPDIQQVVDASRTTTMFIIVIIFFVAALGVINTMLMSVFERTREFGVLKAIGMARRRIFGLIVTEAAALVVISSVVGLGLGLCVDLYMVHHGIDLTSMTGGLSVGGVGLQPVIRGAITTQGLLLPTFILAAICLVASIYPAVRAAQLRPAVGMRET
ncbi:MAG: FtsX-like permease family protein [Kofleriaceae bacterium]